MGNERLISVTLVFTVFMYLMLFQVQEVVAQNLRICEDGLNNCEKYISDKGQYKECLQRECSQQVTEVRSYFELTDAYDNIEYIETCDYGLRKCESINKDKMAYWECVRHSCENAPENYDLNCTKAEGQCTEQAHSYNSCMEFFCPEDEDGKQEQCYKGRTNCEPILRLYWQCIYNICLGDNSIYKMNRVYRKYIKIKDKEGNFVKVRVDKAPTELAGVPEVMREPPKGVNPEEWVRETPTRYILHGNPTTSLKCFRPSALMRCKTNDVRSCICSDGSIPLFKKGAPKPIDPKFWEDE